MLKGISGKFPAGITPEERLEFQKRYLLLAELIVPHLPRASAALGAVICKCAIKYGLPKAIQLAEALRTGVFRGDKDPAKLLWLFLTKAAGMDAVEVYRKTVSGARAFCEDRELGELRFANTDIFDWDQDRTYPVGESALSFERRNQKSSVRNPLDDESSVSSNGTPTQSL
jgi:hypothetical protein